MFAVAWPDGREAVEALLARARPGDRLLFSRIRTGDGGGLTGTVTVRVVEEP
jgi:hypothetical protein